MTNKNDNGAGEVGCLFFLATILLVCIVMVNTYSIKEDFTEHGIIESRTKVFGVALYTVTSDDNVLVVRHQRGKNQLSSLQCGAPGDTIKYQVFSCWFSCPPEIVDCLSGGL